MRGYRVTGAWGAPAVGARRPALVRGPAVHPQVDAGARPCVELRRATRSHAHLLVDRSGFGWTRADRRLRWGARGVSGAGDPGFGVSAAVTVVHPDSETPMPGATAPSAAVRRCTEDGANVCSSGLLAEPVTHVRGAGLLLPRAAAAGDGRLNHLGGGTRAPSRSHNLPDGAQRREWLRSFRCVGFLCLAKPATCPPAPQTPLPRPAVHGIMLTRAWLVFGRARALVEPAGGRWRRCRRCRRRCILHHPAIDLGGVDRDW